MLQKGARVHQGAPGGTVLRIVALVSVRQEDVDTAHMYVLCCGITVGNPRCAVNYFAGCGFMSVCTHPLLCGGCSAAMGCEPARLA